MKKNYKKIKIPFKQSKKFFLIKFTLIIIKQFLLIKL